MLDIAMIQFLIFPPKVSRDGASKMALVALMILTVAFVRASGDPWPAPSACTLPLPKSYVCYHLEKGEKIVVDGKLDESAWKDVGWTLPFMGECVHRKRSKPIAL